MKIALMFSVLMNLCSLVSHAIGAKELSAEEVLNIQNAVDTDRDGIVNAKDNCPGTYNPDQKDILGDGIRDACRSKKEKTEKHKGH